MAYGPSMSTQSQPSGLTKPRPLLELELELSKLFGVKWLCAFVQDVIHNEDLKLDWEFKLSLLTDLVLVSYPSIHYTQLHIGLCNISV